MGEAHKVKSAMILEASKNIFNQTKISSGLLARSVQHFLLLRGSSKYQGILGEFGEKKNVSRYQGIRYRETSSPEKAEAPSPNGSLL